MTDLKIVWVAIGFAALGAIVLFCVGEHIVCWINESMF
jgi:hypothetical protein